MLPRTSRQGSGMVIPMHPGNLGADGAERLTQTLAWRLGQLVLSLSFCLLSNVFYFLTLGHLYHFHTPHFFGTKLIVQSFWLEELGDFHCFL